MSPGYDMSMIFTGNVYQCLFWAPALSRLSAGDLHSVYGVNICRETLLLSQLILYVPLLSGVKIDRNIVFLPCDYLGMVTMLFTIGIRMKLVV